MALDLLRRGTRFDGSGVPDRPADTGSAGDCIVSGGAGVGDGRRAGARTGRLLRLGG